MVNYMAAALVLANAYLWYAKVYKQEDRTPHSLCLLYNEDGLCTSWAHYWSRYLKDGSNADTKGYGSKCLAAGKATAITKVTEDMTTFSCVNECPNGDRVCVIEDDS